MRRRVVTLSRGGQPARAALCDCGEPLRALRCHYCGRSYAEAEITAALQVADPQQRQEQTAAEANLQTLCEACNAGNGARDPHPHDLQSACTPSQPPSDAAR